MTGSRSPASANALPATTNSPPKPLLRRIGGAAGALPSRAVNRALRRFGYRIVKDRPPGAPLDLRNVTDNPIEGLYLAGDRPFVINVPLGRCRGAGSFRCVPGVGHPLIETAEAYLHGCCNRYAGSPLQLYSKAWTPANAAEALGLSGADVSEELLNAPAVEGSILPWSSLTLGETVYQRRERIRRENRLHGAELGADHGCLLFGHSEAKGQLEFERLQRVIESIKQNGYIRSDEREGDIRGYLLLSGEEWIVSVRGGGQHRTAALAALGWLQAPIRIGALARLGLPASVHRHEVQFWPNVRNGLLSSHQALEVFDSIHGAIN
jgi:hypothetical protein